MNPATTRAKPVQMCCVSVGYSTYLMPADKGMKMVELLQSAFECKKDYADGRYAYVIGSQPEVELALVKKDQVRGAAGNPDDAPGAIQLR